MRFFNNIKLWRKFIISYLIIIIIPIYVIGFFLTNKLKDMSFDNSIRLSMVSAQQLKQNLISRISVYSEMMEALIGDPQLNRYINSFYESDYDAFNEYMTYINPLMTRLVYRDSKVVVRLYSENPTIGFSRIVNNTLNDFAVETGIKPEMLSKSGLNWLTGDMRVNLYNEEYMGCYRVFTENARNETVKSVLAVYFKEEELFSLISREGEGEKIIFVYDPDGKIITGTEKTAQGSDTEVKHMISELTTGGFKSGDTVNYNNKPYLLISEQISEKSLNIYNWGIIYMIPAEKLYDGIGRIWKTSLALCLACVVFSLIITLLLSLNITGRISGIIRKMHNVKSGDFKIAAKISGSDEIGILEKDFNSMVREIDRLIHEVYEANLKVKESEIRVKDTEIRNQRIEMERKEAEIIALQGQINPHYLFNTLESIRMKLLLKGDRETSKIINLFAETFRICFDTKSEAYKLADEIKFVDSYITVQKYRYGPKLNYEKKIHDRILEYCIPKLILQPVVENAIYHGIEMKEEGGTVNINICEEEGVLLITVTDDGIGMDDNTLARINKMLEHDILEVKNDGLARMTLRNIHCRLRLIYGDGYGLKIFSKFEEGTTVEIRLPAHRICDLIDEKDE